MNLTNSSEPLGAENGAAYKSEPNDMMYYHTPTSDTINQTEGIFPFLDDEMQMIDGLQMSLADNGKSCLLVNPFHYLCLINHFLFIRSWFFSKGNKLNSIIFNDLL